MNSGAKREPGFPQVQWNHVDGPLLICSDGTPHWLTFLERGLLFFGLTTVKKLDAKRGGAA